MAVTLPTQNNPIKTDNLSFLFTANNTGTTLVLVKKSNTTGDFEWVKPADKGWTVS